MATPPTPKAPGAGPTSSAGGPIRPEPSTHTFSTQKPIWAGAPHVRPQEAARAMDWFMPDFTAIRGATKVASMSSSLALSAAFFGAVWYASRLYEDDGAAAVAVATPQQDGEAAATKGK